MTFDLFAVTIGSPEQTARVAAVLSPHLTPGDVVLLTGDLAAGKTTFVKGVVTALGSTNPVTSPTFTLAQFYSTERGQVLHIDAYRLSGLAEFRDLGLDDSQLPGLHDVADRTSARGRTVEPYGRTYPDYESETGTWQPWYRDLMTGTVGTKDSETEPLGLTPERWALRPGRPGRLTGASGSP